MGNTGWDVKDIPEASIPAIPNQGWDMQAPGAGRIAPTDPTKRRDKREMKPGDWMCPNCNDLQFARNIK